jgi:LysM repeat protein
MKTRLSVLLLISLFLSGCGATAAPTATPVQSTPTVLAPQEPTSTAPIVTPTMTIAATAESTMTPQTTATMPQVQMQVLPDGQQTALPRPGVCQRPQNWVAYTVARNDTLSSLGQRTGTSWQQIQSANCLTSTTIFAGQTLYLPFVPPPIVDITPGPISPTPPPPTFIFSATSSPPGPTKPDVAVTPQLGPPGTIFKFWIKDFPPNEEIIVIIQKEDSEDAVTLGITADGIGNATMSYLSPQNALAGIYNVTVINIPKQKQADGEFTILGTPASAP